ncbi:MAG: hypothetical protein IKV94_00610 [Clostridia bacterium]|nr:hypothetical protein [Clostridia bacterium]
MRYNAIQTSEIIFLKPDLKFELKRVFILGKKQIKYDFFDMMDEVRKFNEKNGVTSYIIAIKYGNVGIKKKNNKFEVLKSAVLNDETDWQVNPVVSEDFPLLEKEVDPVILVMGDKKNMKYRINYYLELVKSGVSGDTALNIIFS